MVMMKSGALLVVLSLLLIFSIAHAREEIKSLPGLERMPSFHMYSGYMNVNPATGRNLFYMFVESANHPSEDPVVLWLQGGPGCSGLVGAFTENGPFRPEKDGKTLSPNPYSWNAAANVIYLESPSGVGFSYSEDKADYNVGDDRTSMDTLNFLYLFFEEFPEFATNDFWISGESYGGHYVPQLAQRIFHANKNSPKLKINFKAFALGNPLIEMQSNIRAQYDVWGTHTLFDYTTYAELKEVCSFYNPRHPDEKRCNMLMNEINKQVGNIDPYDVYTPACLLNSATQLRQLVRVMGPAVPAIDAMRHLPLHSVTKESPFILPELKNHQNQLPQDPSPSGPIDYCIDTYAQDYLNMPTVQDALHARPGTQWLECSNTLNYNMNDTLRDITPLLADFLKEPDFRFMVYSGDVDSVCATLSSEYWIEQLNLTAQDVTAKWRPWLDGGNQVGGYVKVFKDKFTFATVHNSGHMVPFFQPMRAWDMFSRFFRDTPL